PQIADDSKKIRHAAGDFLRMAEQRTARSDLDGQKAFFAVLSREMNDKDAPAHLVYRLTKSVAEECAPGLLHVRKQRVPALDKRRRQRVYWSYRNAHDGQARAVRCKAAVLISAGVEGSPPISPMKNSK